MKKKIIAALMAFSLLPNVPVFADTKIAELSARQTGSYVEITGSITDMAVAKVQYTILKPGYSSADENNLSNSAALIGQGDASENGEFSFSVSIGSSAESGEYTVVLNTFKGGEAAKTVFSYISDKERGGLLDIFNSGNSSSVYNALEDDDNKALIESFGISLDEYAALSRQQKQQICAMIASDYTGTGAYNADNFGRAFDVATVCTAILNAADSKVYELLRSNSELLGIDTSDMKDDPLVAEYVKGVTESDKFTGFVKAFNRAKAVSAVNNTTSYMDIYDVLRKYNDIFEINFNGYNALSKSSQISVCKSVIGTYRTPEAVEESFTSAVEAASSKRQSESGGNGGGLSSGSQSVGLTTGMLNGNGANTDAVSAENTANSQKEIIFSDISDTHWAKAAILTLAQKGIVSGTGNNLFEPDRRITRAEFVRLIVSAFDIPTEGKTCSYSDVNENDWFYESVAAASEAGIIYGIDEDTFGSDTDITRQDIAVISYRAATYADLMPTETTTVEFTDESDISEYAYEAVSTLASAGVISGMDDGSFRPLENATRAQAARVIYMLTEDGAADEAISGGTESTSETQSQNGKTNYAQILTGIGVADGSVKPEQNVTRGEFAKLAYKLAGQGVTGEGASPFSDVPENSEYYDSVMFLYGKNIISDSGDGVFNVSAPIEVNDAAMIAVSAAGLGFFAEENGGYPEGYLNAAASEKLFDGVKTDASGHMTYENACRMIYNTFDVSIWEVTPNSGRVTYEKNDDRTILSEYLGLDRIKGIMTDNGITGYNGTSGTGDDNVVINGILCENSNIAYRAYLGYNVEAYVHVERDGTVRLVYVYPVKNRTLNINSYDIDTAETDKLEYAATSESKRTKRVKLSKTMELVYNNKVIPFRSAEQLIPEKGTVELVDNNNDGTYDVYKIWEYTAHVAEMADSNSGKIYTKYQDETISLKDYDTYHIYMNDEEIGIEDIEEYNVLSVFVGDGGNTVDIYVTDNMIEGKINKISNEYIYVSDEPYRYTEVLNKEPYTGMQAKVMLDIMGYVAALDTVFGGGNVYGYVLNAYFEDNREDVEVKMFTTNGFVEILECANNVTVDGVKKKKAEIVDLLTEDGDAVNQAVMFEVNGEGKLITLDTLNDGSGGDKDFLKKNLDASRQRFKQDGIFGGRVSATQDTAIIRIPIDISDTDEYRLCRTSEFEVDKSYNIEAYNCSIVNIPELILWYATADDSFNNADITYLVDEVSSGVNEEGDNIKIVRGFGKAGEKTIYSYEDRDYFEDVSPGDIIHCETKNTGYVRKFESVFDGIHQELLSSSVDYFNTYSVNYLTVKAADQGRILAEIKGVDYVFNLSGATIYEYTMSASKDHVEQLNYNDIRAGDVLFVQTKAGDVRMAVLYR